MSLFPIGCRLSADDMVLMCPCLFYVLLSGSMLQTITVWKKKDLPSCNGRSAIPDRHVMSLPLAPWTFSFIFINLDCVSFWIASKILIEIMVAVDPLLTRKAAWMTSTLHSVQTPLLHLVDVWPKCPIQAAKSFSKVDHVLSVCFRPDWFLAQFASDWSFILIYWTVYHVVKLPLLYTSEQ